MASSIAAHGDELPLRQAQGAEQAEDSVPEGHEDLRHDPQLRQLRERGRFEYGCQHYKRRCRMVAPCCGEVFWCRHCHNKAKNEEEEARSRSRLHNWCGCLPIGISVIHLLKSRARGAEHSHKVLPLVLIHHRQQVSLACLMEDFVTCRSPRIGTSWIGNWCERWSARCAATDNRSRATAAAARSGLSAVTRLRPVQTLCAV